MSFTEVQHQPAAPSKPSHGPTALSDDGDPLLRVLGGYGPVKRLIDIVAAVSLLILGAPLMLMVGLAG